MRVALLTQNARTGDAIGRAVFEKLSYFLDRGAQVRVVVADQRGLHPALKPYTVRLSADDLRGAGFLALMQADLVVVDFSQFYPLLELMPLIADGSRRVIIDYHGITPAAYTTGDQREACLNGIEWAGIAGFADSVLAHSRFAASELTESVALPHDRIHRLAFPIDERFSAGEASRPLRARLALGSARLLLFVGRLALNKRLPVLIQAVARLRHLESPFHAVVVGPSGECYEAERLRCRELAADLGVSDRLHFLGAVDEATLLDCYRSADALVMPSLHEGFCLPVIEAMACGLPVIAARAAALPETVGDAGLTFAPNDPADLARKIEQLFAPVTPVTVNRIAIVTPACGEVVGGAERSLMSMADALHRAGHAVEVFTVRNESSAQPPYPVHVFPAHVVDDMRRAASSERCADGESEHEATYWQNTLRSDALIAALSKRGPFAAILVGPAPTGLSRDVVRRFGSRVILVPCLHNEPVSRFAAIRDMYASVGGVIYHSTEEGELASAQLGLNHPNTTVIGASIEVNPSQPIEPKQPRYLVSVGRRVAEKNLPQLFEWARQYHDEFPDRFRFAFVGEGPIGVPSEPWAVDLGRLSDAEKEAVVGGSSALLQLSTNESLSLVVLEAQALGVPVIVNAAAPVLAGHVERGNGGRSVRDYREFANALNEFWEEPQTAQRLGKAGQAYVAQNFGVREQFIEPLCNVIANLDRPLPVVMREVGVRRAELFARSHWRQELDRIIECVMDRPATPMKQDVELVAMDSVVASDVCRLVVRHRRGMPLVPTGSGRTEIVMRMRDSAGAVIGSPYSVALREVIAAGDEVTIAVPVNVSHREGQMSLEPGLRTLRPNQPDEVTWFGPLATLQPSAVTVRIERISRKRTPVLDRVVGLANLPDDYVDVTTGRFARWKRWLKSKLLHNFKVAYVDVLSRQQSRFNRRVIEAIEQIEVPPSDASLRAELAESRRLCDELAKRIARLEAERGPQIVRREAS